MISATIAAFIGAAALAYYFTRGAEVAVPNVIGKTESQARDLLTRSGLSVQVIEVYDATSEPVGTVIRQIPKPGSIVRKPFPVKINVSRPK
jgi:serine/threonine-protein kinase